MSAPPAPIQLGDAQRDGLIKELFAHYQATEPDKHHCFCGSDQDLVDAITQARAERERAADDEIGG